MADPRYIEVPEDVENVRADRFLADHFQDISRTRLQLSFTSGHVRVNDELVQKRYLLNTGDSIEIYLPEPEQTQVNPVHMDLEVLYEDDDLLLVNKPAGVITHPGAGTGEDTLVHGILHHCNGVLSTLGGAERPGVVHRLDKDTSGIIMFAKTDGAYLRLVQMFAERNLEKTYFALVHGHPKLASGVIDQPIGRNPKNRTKMQVNKKGKEAKTSWVLHNVVGDDHALLKCELHTGRTHQIRVHLAHLGHPIVGDILYGNNNEQVERFVAPRQMLHAFSLQFTHPVTSGIISVEARIPEDFNACMQAQDTVE